MAVPGTQLLLTGRPVGFEELTVTGTAKALQSVPSGANYAILRVETKALRYRDDGTNPTASVGMPLNVNDTLTIDNEETLNAVKFIRQSTNSKISVLYYRRG